MDLSVNTPEKLLNAFRTVNPTSPRLTWYGPDSERVEFSGRVLDNWVAKTANYLVDELDAEPGTVIAVDLPLHWRSMVWLLATWAVGATADTSSGASSAAAGVAEVAADIIATDSPDAVHNHLPGTKTDPLVVAVALPALQMRWMGELAPRTLDYAGEVRSHADVFFADDTPAADSTAWRHDGAETSYAHLLTEETSAPQRALLEGRNGWDAVVREALQVWAAGGSVVLLGEDVPATDTVRSNEHTTLG